MESFDATMLPKGTVLNSAYSSYEIKDVLGSGGFGITYLATAVTTVGNIPVKFDVAIKEHFLKSDCERDQTGTKISYSMPAANRVETSCRDFVSEANRLQSIAGKHKNIVRVNEVFEANGTAYYVMELLRGETLKNYIKRKGPMSVKRMLKLLLPVCDAVGYLHSIKITHLDLKPDNIMLTRDEEGKARPVVIDFGLSKHYKEDGSVTSTIGLQGATDGFAPIEQYSGVSVYSPGSDVYSLAATILYCLTGKVLPVASEVTPELIMREIPTDIPQRLREILIKSLSIKIDDRPADCRQLTMMLREVAKALGQSGEEPALPSRPASMPVYAGGERTAMASDDSRTVVATPPMPGVSGRPVPGSVPGGYPPNMPTVASPGPMGQPGYGGGYNRPGLHQNQYPGPTGGWERPVGGGEPDTSKGSTKIALWLVIGVMAVLIVIMGIYVFSKNDSGYQEPINDSLMVEEDGGDIDGYRDRDLAERSNRGGDAKSDPTAVRSGSGASTATRRGQYDHAFHQLVPGSGVKSLTWSGNTFTFDRDGEWTNQYYEDALKDRNWDINDGRRESEYYSYKGEFGVMNYEWSGTNVTSIYDQTRGWYVNRSYNSDGTLYSSTTNYYSDKPSKTIYYSDYKFDSHGNWISRKAGGSTERRTITYY